MGNVDLNALSAEEKRALLNKLQTEEKEESTRRRDAYESIRAQHLIDVKSRFIEYVQHGKDFKKWLRGEADAFYAVLREYGQLKRDDQLGYTVADDDFKEQVKGARVKKFDERADIAEKRMVDFLNKWITDNNGGKPNPMYKLAMAMIQRNEVGDLDYKCISRLYELEADFNDPEYTEIMNLFRESNVVEGTAINFYFETKNQYNIWQKEEPSFNRL